MQSVLSTQIYEYRGAQILMAQKISKNMNQFQAASSSRDTPAIANHIVARCRFDSSRCWLLGLFMFCSTTTTICHLSPAKNDFTHQNFQSQVRRGGLGRPKKTADPWPHRPRPTWRFHPWRPSLTWAQCSNEIVRRINLDCLIFLFGYVLGLLCACCLPLSLPF